LNTRQLFSQDSQTYYLDSDEGLAEERRIQRAFLEATEHSKKAGRCVTFTEVANDDENLTTPNEGDELQTDDDLGTSLAIKDILNNLDEGADQFAEEVQARPHYVYGPMGKLCSSLRLLQKHNDLLHQSNARNKDVREQLATSLSDTQKSLKEATATINELAEECGPRDGPRASVQLEKMKEKTRWYANALKEKDTTVDELNNEVAGLAQDHDDLEDECARLKRELAAAEKELAVSRTRDRSHSRSSSHARRPIASLSPYSKAHGIGPPPLPRRDRDHRQQARSESRTRPQIQHDQDHCTGREATAATDNSRLSTASSASVNLDPGSSKAIAVDRSVKDPDTFEGKATTFYPWLTAMTLKLSTATFRAESDGLRYVQGFLGGPPWALVAPRVPTTGSWGKPCPNPFPDVDSMMKLLSERYGEDNTEERAMNAMVILKQTDKQDFNEFYAKYQEHQAYCPLTTDKQEVHRLQGKLNRRFRDKLNDGMEVLSSKDLVARCTRLQTQWESMDAPASSESGNGRRSRRKDKDEDEPAADVRKSYNKVHMPDNELPREFRNMPSLTNELRQSLRDSGGCYKCRKPGHTGNQRDKCPLAILEDAYAAKHPKVNPVEVGAVDETPPGNGTATR
jgi:hypothetical protein